MDSKSVVAGEFERWCLKWQTVPDSDKPDNPIDAIQYCDKLCFPNIRKLLIFFSILLVTTASSERTFLTLRRLKTYIRSTIGENSLNGLAQMTINRDIEINIEAVIDELAKKPRRLDFIL